MLVPGDSVIRRISASRRNGIYWISGSRGFDGRTVYHPVITTQPPALLSDDAGHAAILHSSTQQIVSQDIPATPGEALEISASGTPSRTGDMTTDRWGYAATLLNRRHDCYPSLVTGPEPERSSTRAHIRLYRTGIRPCLERS